MQRRTPTEFRDSIRKVRRLYSTPEVLAKSLRLVQQPEVDLETVGTVVRNDPALVADLVRLSNSALFGRGDTCVELHIALQRLGLQQVIRAIEMSLSKNVFGKGLENYGVAAIQFWRISMLAALLMEQLAFIHGVDAPEAYAVGILHALGRVLINEVLEEIDSAQPWDRSQPLELWEVQQVGFTHAEAGALLLRDWGFPPSIVNPIENQLGAPVTVSAQSPVGMIRFVRILLSHDPEAGLQPSPTILHADLLGWAGFAKEAEALELLFDAQTELRAIGESLGINL